jgi:hypothetical protein
MPLEAAENGKAYIYISKKLNPLKKPKKL